jgi:hypothetical protein
MANVGIHRLGRKKPNDCMSVPAKYHQKQLCLRNAKSRRGVVIPFFSGSGGLMKYAAGLRRTT